VNTAAPLPARDDGAVRRLMSADRRGKRPQRVYTPLVVVDVMLRTWPEGVLCDPCSGPDSIVPAAIRIMPPQNGCRYARKIPQLDDLGEPVADDEGKLLYVDAPPGLPHWPPRTYINPEWLDLAAWLRQFGESDEVIVLCPARSNRAWWRSAMRSAAAVAELAPLAFVGHKSKFPAPLVLAYRGNRRDRFCEAIAATKIGEIR
jgi:hypothetical protein